MKIGNNILSKPPKHIQRGHQAIIDLQLTEKQKNAILNINIRKSRWSLIRKWGGDDFMYDLYDLNIIEDNDYWSRGAWIEKIKFTKKGNEIREALKTQLIAKTATFSTQENISNVGGYTYLGSRSDGTIRITRQQSKRVKTITYIIKDADALVQYQSFRAKAMYTILTPNDDRGLNSSYLSLGETSLKPDHEELNKYNNWLQNFLEVNGKKIIVSTPIDKTDPIVLSDTEYYAINNETLKLFRYMARRKKSLRLLYNQIPYNTNQKTIRRLLETLPKLT
jgi:hypothetical protein